jgi:hypothetical protein
LICSSVRSLRMDISLPWRMVLPAEMDYSREQRKAPSPD